VIKFVSDLGEVGGFLRVLRSPPIKLTTTIYEPAGKENEGEGYDQVTYQQQHTADKDNIYDHMSNLI
jgi:hypothetical protein